MFWSDVICEKPDAINQLPEEMIRLHWDYAPNVSEERLKKLIDAGAKRLYVCPGAQGWNHLINAQHLAYENISKMCLLAHRYHSMGILTTDWGDYGHINHPEFSRLGLIYGAAFSWSDVLLTEDEINRQISVVEYGDNTESLCNFFKKLSQWEAFPWYHVVRTLEILANTGDVKAVAKFIQELDASHVSEFNAEIDKQLNALYTYLGTSKPYTQNTIYAYIIAAEGQKLLNLLLPILKHTLAGEPVHSSIPPAKLSSMLEKWLVVYRKLWKTTSKESEFYRIANLFFYCADYLRTLSV